MFSFKQSFKFVDAEKLAESRLMGNFFIILNYLIKYCYIKNFTNTILNIQRWQYTVSGVTSVINIKHENTSKKQQKMEI